jgi:preprotein translocase subunit SecA
VEAKEGVKIQRENQTLATITFQNYFRMYKKLSGMTGTAETEAAEFQKTYNIDVTVVPTNRTMIRKEFPDLVYRTEDEKFRNAAKEIQKYHGTGQPVLVGTISVEKSERLAAILKKMGVRHEILNAKNHEREAFIVAQAGRKGAVVVSTNMAGRGTDILLGGNPEFMTKEACLKDKVAERISPEEAKFVADEHFYYFTHLDQFYRVRRDKWDELFLRFKGETDQEHDEVVELGGLHIVATERHESRRIDNQLRGRAGRQGDPGSSRFFLSLQDDLLRIFGGERMQNLMLRLGMEEDVPIESKLITKRIAKAQEAVEVQNFEARKHLLEYDDVMNKQREAVYGTRKQLLEGMEQKELILEDYVAGIVSNILEEFAPETKHPDQWDLAGLKQKLTEHFGFNAETEGIAFDTLNRHELGDTLFDKLKEKYELKEQIIGSQGMRYHERMIMLSVLDGLWKDHLLNMDHLKEGIGLRGYGQQDPLVAYKKESFDMFEGMMTRFQEDTVRYLFMMQIVGPDGQPITRPIQQQPVQPVLPAQQHPAQQPLPELNGHGVPPIPAQQHVQSPAPRQTWRPMPVGSTPTPGTRTPETRTTIDEIEREFARKKKKELEQARAAGSNGHGATQVEQRRTGEKVGRNDPCPCGSGLKYKKCHGKDGGDGD